MTMKGANYLEKLLDNQPVEWKKLGEVCRIIGRIGFRGYTRKDIVSQGEGAISISPTNIKNQVLNLDPEISTYISWSKYEESPEIMIEEGDVVLAKTASVGKVGLVRTLLEKATLNPQMVVLKDIDCNPAYLYYYLTGSVFQTKIKSIAGIGSVPNISQSKLSTIEIPLPPLSVQERIVEILDKFTSLEAELDCRKRQYIYYRELLLDFSQHNNIQWKKLGEVCTKVCSGGTPSTSNPEYYKGNIPWLRTQDVDWKDVYDTDIKITEEAIKHSSAQWIPANCVIVAMYGATAAKACINRIPLTTNQACCNLQVDENIANYKYVYHWICREYERLRALGEGSQSNLSGKKIKDYKIPLPPLSEQQRIVEILDKFDTLTNSISEGLPLEIQLRRQQSEYYREQLLDFRR